MTETLPLPSSSAGPADGAPGPSAEPDVARPRPLVTGARAAVLAASGSLLAVTALVLAGWLAGDRTGTSWLDALRAAAQVWLLAHGTALEMPTGRYSVTPLGLTAAVLALLWRAGRSVTREESAGSVPAAARVALTVAVPYAAATGAVALMCGSGPVQPSPISALAAGGGVAFVGAGAGVLRLDRDLGARARRTLGAAGAALAVLLGAAAALVGGSLALHAERAAELSASTAPGPVAGAGLLLLGLAHVPNAVVWGACWLAGPGFAVGTGTAVGPFAHELGAVPALPLLAALPSAPAPAWAAVLALGVPLAAGALAGRVLHRRGGEVTRTGAVADVVLTALWCAGGVALLAALSGGAAGGQRLASVGPTPQSAGLAVAAEVAATAAVTLVVLRRRARRVRPQDC